MDIGKISHQQTYEKFGREYVDSAQEGLMFRDSNNDGQVTAIEMYKDCADSWGKRFEGNEAFSKRAEELNLAQGEIYSKYAGSDGVLDKFEFVEALNSDEMDVLLEQLWEMENIIRAENGEDVALNWYDSNNDRSTSSVDVYKSKSDLYSNIFSDDKNKAKQADEIAQKQAEILSKYEGDDGKLSSEEFTQAVNSFEYKRTVADYNKLF